MEFTFLDMEVTLGKRYACVRVMGWGRETERGLILRNWLTPLWRLASSKSAGQASRLGAPGEQLTLQVRSAGSLEAEFPLVRGGPSFSMKADN